MNMVEPKLFSLADLLNKRLFKIPSYQRYYSWQSKQRKNLFDDIKKSYLAKNAKYHFMATIVGLRQKIVTIITDEYKEFDIVDGQQRITTLILLFKAIAKALNRSGSDKTEQRTRTEIDEMLVKPDKASLLLLQTNHDGKGYFADYIRDGKNPDPNSAKTSAEYQLLLAMKECEDFVRDWQANGGSLTKLYQHLKNRLFFIFYEIDDEGLVYTVFEILNSRGLEVSWFDRLKSMLMAVMFEAPTDRSLALIAEVHDHWTEIYKIIGLRLELSTESLRFAATLRSKKSQNRPLSEENAVQCLFEQSQDPRSVIETTKWIKSVTEALDKLVADHRRNAVTKIVQARIVAVAVNLRSDLTEDEKAQILRRWENVTFRIYGMYAKDSRTAVGDYVRLAGKIEKEKLSIDKIMDALSEIGERYPCDKAVKELRDTELYPDWREELRYIFFRYEEHLARKAGQNFDNKQ